MKKHKIHQWKWLLFSSIPLSLLTITPIISACTVKQKNIDKQYSDQDLLHISNLMLEEYNPLNSFNYSQTNNLSFVSINTNDKSKPSMYFKITSYFEEYILDSINPNNSNYEHYIMRIWDNIINRWEITIRFNIKYKTPKTNEEKHDFDRYKDDVDTNKLLERFKQHNNDHLVYIYNQQQNNQKPMFFSGVSKYTKNQDETYTLKPSILQTTNIKDQFLKSKTISQKEYTLKSIQHKYDFNLYLPSFLIHTNNKDFLNIYKKLLSVYDIELEMRFYDRKTSTNARWLRNLMVDDEKQELSFK